MCTTGFFNGYVEFVGNSNVKEVLLQPLMEFLFDSYPISIVDF